MNLVVAAAATTPTRHVPLRSCLYCRRSMPRGRPLDGLIRLVNTAGGFELDLSRSKGGRGAWLCRDCAASLVAGNEKEKQVRRAFGARADEVRELLKHALAADPARRSPVPGNMDGGVDVG